MKGEEEREVERGGVEAHCQCTNYRDRGVAQIGEPQSSGSRHSIICGVD